MQRKSNQRNNIKMGKSWRIPKGVVNKVTKTGVTLGDKER